MDRASCRREARANGRTEDHDGQPSVLGRRALVAGVLAAPFVLRPTTVLARPEGGLSRPMDVVSQSGGKRRLRLVRAHDKAVLSVIFHAGGQYQTGALREIDDFMRDRHSGKKHRIDRNLIELLHVLDQSVGAAGPMHLVSGYRTKATNTALREQSRRVAVNSMHLQGKAADIQLPGQDIRPLRDVALRLAAGGVGYYGRSRHLHIDVGPVRAWPHYLVSKLNG